MKFVCAILYAVAFQVFSSIDGVFAEVDRSSNRSKRLRTETSARSFEESTNKQMTDDADKTVEGTEKDDESHADDSAYWYRFLQDKSMSMSFKQCNVQVDLDCKDLESEGKCSDIEEPPSFDCPAQQQTLKFKYNTSTCADENNDQDDSTCNSASCDINDGSDRVLCVNDGIVFCNCTVQEGGLVVLTSDNFLPTNMECTVIRENSTETCISQQFTFDPSGDSPLSLQDEFGSLTLETCTDSSNVTASCLVDVQYTFIYANTGDVNLTVVAFDRIFNGVEADLLDDRLVVIEPGTAGAVVENSTIDACQPSVNATVYIEGKTDDGTTCSDESNLFFDILPASCDIDLDIGCRQDDSALTCDEIEAPDRNCSSDQTELKFTYNNTCPCDFEENEQDDSTCNSTSCDINDGSDRVLCVNNGTVFCNCTVEEGGLIVLTSDNFLPTNMECTVIRENSTDSCISQEFTFDPSGDSPLSLQDEFGSLTLETCTNSSNVTLSCLVDVTYTYTLDNTGDVDLNITGLNRTLDGTFVDLFLGQPPIPISSKSAIAPFERRRFNACKGFVDITAEVTGVTAAGGSCAADDEVTFGTRPSAPPRPDCSTTNAPTNAPTISPPSSLTNPPSSSPTKSPTSSPTKSPSPFINLVFTGDGSPKSRLGLCEGDCDKNRDCQNGLICYQRHGNLAIPGCDGGEDDNSRSDYCIASTALPMIKVVHNGTGDHSEILGRCEGDCDYNEDCSDGLVCFQRERDEAVPGCDGGSNDHSLTDYCTIDTALPMIKVVHNGKGDHSEILGRCEGDCDYNEDCSDGLVCFQRERDQAVPGCVGGSNDHSLTDYCTIDTH